MSTVGLSFRNVGNMNLNDGNTDGADAVGDGDGGVGIGSRIHHYATIEAVSLLQFVDDDAFVVGLEIGNLVLWKATAQPGQKVLKRDVSVDFGFAFAQEVQVGAVENEDFHALKEFSLPRQNYWILACY